MLLDLHRHLEGSHSPRALAHVARTFDIRDPVFFDAAGNRFRSEDELRQQLTLTRPSDDPTRFYQSIVQARAAYVSVDAIAMLADFAFNEAADDTDGFEMRLSLFSMARTLIERQGLAWRDVDPTAFADRYARPILTAVIAARDHVAHERRKPMLLRLGLSRTFESEVHYRALCAMAKDHANALVGLDILGIVQGDDTEPLPTGLLRVIDDLRTVLPDLTVHAGEFADHHSIDKTLALSPRGIGHGIHALASPQTLERLHAQGVTLEVCPTSNALLIPTAAERLALANGGRMPLRALQAHVHCVLGSDDPTPLGTTFQRELQLAKAGGVDMARLEADMMRRFEQLAPGALG